MRYCKNCNRILADDEPFCRSCCPPDTAPEDNWAFAPLGDVVYVEDEPSPAPEVKIEVMEDAPVSALTETQQFNMAFDFNDLTLVGEPVKAKGINYLDEVPKAPRTPKAGEDELKNALDVLFGDKKDEVNAFLHANGGDGEKNTGATAEPVSVNAQPGRTRDSAPQSEPGSTAVNPDFFSASGKLSESAGSDSTTGLDDSFEVLPVFADFAGAGKASAKKDTPPSTEGADVTGVENTGAIVPGKIKVKYGIGSAGKPQQPNLNSGQQAPVPGKSVSGKRGDNTSDTEGSCGYDQNVSVRAESDNAELEQDRVLNVENNTILEKNVFPPEGNDNGLGQTNTPPKGNKHSRERSREQGVQDIQDVQETQGAQDVQRAQGAQVVQQAQGAQGVQQAQGAQGVQKAQGAQGVQQARGAQGVQQAQGNQDVKDIHAAQRAQDAHAVHAARDVPAASDGEPADPACGENAAALRDWLKQNDELNFDDVAVELPPAPKLSAAQKKEIGALEKELNERETVQPGDGDSRPYGKLGITILVVLLFGLIAVVGASIGRLAGTSGEQAALLSKITGSWLSDDFSLRDTPDEALKEHLTITADGEFVTSCYKPDDSLDGYLTGEWLLVYTISGKVDSFVDKNIILSFTYEQGGQQYYFIREILSVSDDELVLREYYDETHEDYYDMTSKRIER